jgi:hypothetical protein
VSQQKMDSRDSGDAVHRERENRGCERVGISNANDAQDRGMIAYQRPRVLVKSEASVCNDAAM